MQKKTNYGVLLIIIASICWSLNSPLIKSMQLDAFTLAGMRSLIAGVALLPFLRPKKICWNIYTALFLLTYTVQCTCIVLALKLTSAPIAVGMQFTAPVWLYFVEHKKGEKHSLKRVWPLIILLIGTVLFMCSTGEGVTLKGNLVALSTSFTFAALTYFSKKCTGDNPLGMTSISGLCCGLIVMLLLVKQPMQTVLAIPSEQWLPLIILGVVQIGLGYGLYYTGMRFTSAKTAAMISPLEMVLGPLWVALFLHEYPDFIALLGFIFVIIGVIGEVVATRKQAPAVPEASSGEETPAAPEA